MINQQLINPQSIVVVGGSDDVAKPGGKVLKNIIDGGFAGKLYVVNPKMDSIQGIDSYRDIRDLPLVDLAVLAVPAKLCPDAVRVLTGEKETRAFIILSAGFGEESEEGERMEEEIVEMIDEVDGCLIGPNCIGVINTAYNAVFTTPIPRLDPQGCDFISGSGATAVFIMESGIPNGLTFASVYSVGNSAQLGVEEVLQYLDETHDPETCSPVKLLYIETINKPDILLKHARSLIRKGCRIAAIKSGSSEAGSRAASSHTGALASSDLAVDALFRKAGIVRCYSRQELAAVASVFLHRKLPGKNLALISNAGGPCVMLTDALSDGGLEVPEIKGVEAIKLLEKLHPGSSVSNPIDFLATGTAEQLAEIIDACETKFDNIDGMIIIFGSPGLVPIHAVYDVLEEKMRSCRKPIFPVLPSVINAKDEIARFLSRGRINFPDEVALGRALSKVVATELPAPDISGVTGYDEPEIRSVIGQSDNGYLSPDYTLRLLHAAGIQCIDERIARSSGDASQAATELGFPVVMKVIGPVHKSDVGGVVLGIENKEDVIRAFDRLMQIEGTETVLIQPDIEGMELYAGAKREPRFGHMVLCGPGGIFIEIMKDISVALAPVSPVEAKRMVENLKSYPMLTGTRGMPPVNIGRFEEIIRRLSSLVTIAPEIFEMDINPMIATGDEIIVVDARIRVEKEG